MAPSVLIHIRGLVQGVGFRPFIFKLAGQLGIVGWVRNTNEGVEIHALSDKPHLHEFIRRIKTDAPAASLINDISWENTRPENVTGFRIRKSEDRSSEVTEISPDIAVCDSCLADMDMQKHRKSYPLINCTHCGPRFSIIRDLPYDRPNTSMNLFPMCTRCKSEYEDVMDRRFHAQPVACLHCGPKFDLISGDDEISWDIRKILSRVNNHLVEGKIIAIKGVGGYHLACDMTNSAAVQKLREKKRRDGKPFAVMFRDVGTLRKYALVSDTERQVLTTWRRPVVILKLKAKAMREGHFGPVNSNLSTIGAFLPYMPIHHLLFRHFQGPAIVLTSGNISDEPIVKDDEVALRTFKPIADAFLSYNREIVNRSDDSVVRVIDRKVSIYRRSRGYAPSPVNLSLDVTNIIALGAELSSCFCVGKGKRAFPSQYIGDLKSIANLSFYEQTLKDFQRLFRVSPELIACDLHPGYFSTRVGEDSFNLPLIRVQHHFAHIASCMAEHHLDEKVIGVAFDGTGYGSDGKMWGGEFLVCDLLDFRRALHFEYIPLPGGDKAVEEPWRTAIAYLCKVYGSSFESLPLPLFRQIEKKKWKTVANMVNQKLNCPEVSSVGRLFDAVASIINVCHVSIFQAEAPMRLESLAARGCTGCYSYQIDKTIRVGSMIREIVTDVTKELDVGLISAKFHNTIISIIFDSVNMISKKEGIRKLVLSGGVFQNKVILEGSMKQLKKAGFMVYTNEQMPVNDGGIALGQMAIAAKMRSESCV